MLLHNTIRNDIVCKLGFFHLVLIVLANYALTFEYSFLGIISSFDLVFPMIFVTTIFVTYVYGDKTAKRAVYFLTVPVGLVSYWITAGTIQILDQSIVGVGIGASCAYLVGQFAAAHIFEKMRYFSFWQVSFAVSLLLATLYDTLTFYITLAYGQSYATTGWLMMCFNGIAVKTATSITLVGVICTLIYFYLANKSQQNVL